MMHSHKEADFRTHKCHRVLILVVMDDALALKQIKNKKDEKV